MLHKYRNVTVPSYLYGINYKPVETVSILTMELKNGKVQCI